jgi:hypothetical protein
METIKISRIRDKQRNASLNKIIKDIKTDTLEKVHTIAT